VSPSLAQLGRKTPTRDQLDAARIAGELAAFVPNVLPQNIPDNQLDSEKENDVFANMTEAEIEAAAVALAAKLPDFAALDTHADFKAVVQEEFFSMFFSSGGASHARI